MHKQKPLVLILLFLCCVSSGLFAQISVLPANGCLPAGITNALFSYTGPGTPVNVSWDFGDGSPASTLLPTQHSYPNLGTYIVTFKATVNGSPVIYTQTVAVHSPPTGNFSQTLPASHCYPMTVAFSGSSTNNNVAYTWAFGDLGGGTGASVSHAYQSPGTYIPNVTIQNTLTGCFVTVAGSAIHVSNPPSIAITANPGFSSCSPSFITALDGSGSTSGSPTGQGLTYNWNLGPFGSFTQANTGNVVFTPVGTYIVTLTVTDNNNCSADKTVKISLESPTVSAVVPPTVCINGQTPYQPPFFIATVSSNQPSTKWEMGDGTTLIFPIPLPPPQITPVLVQSVAYSGTLHNYVTPGLKIVTISAQTGACTTSITKTIFVEEIKPAFTGVPPIFSCAPLFTVGYTDQTTINSGSPLTYDWQISNWAGNSNAQSSTAMNPTFTVTQGSFNPYTHFADPEPYYVQARLVVTSQPAGCIIDVKQILDVMQRPTAAFEILDEAEGCAPLTVTFSNTSVANVISTNTNIANPILTYTWDFGVSPSSTLAGNAVPGPNPIPNASYVYSSPGVYYVTLSITTASGCTHTSYQHTVTVETPPTISYTLPSPATACLGKPFTVTLAPGPGETVQHWHLDGDQGYYSGCVSDNKPTWEFNHYGNGSQVFTITAYQNGCKSSVVTTPVTVKGPLGKLRYATDCTEPKNVTFFYHLEDVRDATIDFGDGTLVMPISGSPGMVIAGSVTHSYTSPGDYIATITSSNTPNSCGPYKFTLAVNVRDLAAHFVFANPSHGVLCPAGNFTVDASTSVGVFTTQGRGYTWYIDNEPPIQMENYTLTTVSPTLVGMHTLKLVVKDVNGCLSTDVQTFRVSSPVADFTFALNPVCFSDQMGPNPVQMINLTPQVPDVVSNYTWKMGDSILYQNPPYPYHTFITGTTPNHSPTFSYPSLKQQQTMTFTVTLEATNVLGCTSSTSKTITVNDPLLKVQLDKPFACVPVTKTFSFTAGTTHSTYALDYGEGPIVNITNFTNNAVYTNPHYYSTAGSYTATFKLTDIAGCTTTQTMELKMEAYPVASFTFENVINKVPGPGDFCAPFSPSVTSTSQRSSPVVYTWDLGLTGPQSTQDSTATDNYPDSEGSYILSLTVKTALAGCASSTQVPVNVFAPKINFRIEPDSLKTIYCLGEPILLKITNHSGIKSGYQYDFGDGVVTSRILPVNAIPSTLLVTYPNVYYPEHTNGTLNIQLVGYAEGGVTVCKDVKYKTVKVIRVRPDFKRNNELLRLDSIHCLGDLEVFKNQSTSNNTNAVLVYTWSPGDGSPEQTGTDVTHTYPSPGTYSVKLQALDPEFGCTASVTKKMVIFPDPTGNFSLAPFSCPGTAFLINGSGKPGVSGILTGTLQPGGTPLSFDGSNTFSLSTTASVSTTYTLKVVDDNGCENSASTASIFIQQPAPVIHWDTTVVIGQPAPLNAYVGPGFSYTWSPLVDYLDCDTCLTYNPVSSSTINITYSVMVEDGKQCSIVKNTYRVNIELKASLDVPSAFTPNGDGVNDVIFPDGWGLMKLNYFRVFNRWGQLVFESNDLNIGWDGVYQGVPQNMETYVYQVSVDTYSEKQPTLTKTGTFKLLR